MGANLQKAILWGANLQGANLEGANLQGAQVDNDTIWPEDFKIRQSVVMQE